MIRCITGRRSVCFGAFAVLLLASFGCGHGELSKAMHAPDLDTTKALWQRPAQLANSETKSKGRAMLQFGSPNSICSWTSTGFGYLNCQPTRFPSSVLKKVGKKGRFYKDYLQLADKCNSVGFMDLNDTTSCPKGCRESVGICDPPTLFDYLACPGSVAKGRLTCASIGTESACSAVPECKWDSFECSFDGLVDSDVSAIISGAPFGLLDTFFSRTADLALWQKAYGKCPGSLFLFNRQVCSTINDLLDSLGKADCLKFKQCEWIDDGGKGVFKGCVRRKTSLTAIMYGGDPALSNHAAKCFKHDDDQAACDAQA